MCLDVGSTTMRMVVRSQPIDMITLEHHHPLLCIARQRNATASTVNQRSHTVDPRTVIHTDAPRIMTHIDDPRSHIPIVSQNQKSGTHIVSQKSGIHTRDLHRPRVPHRTLLPASTTLIDIVSRPGHQATIGIRESQGLLLPRHEVTTQLAIARGTMLPQAQTDLITPRDLIIETDRITEMT